MKKHIFVLIGLAALLMGCNNGKNAGTAEAQPANGSENQVVAADTAVKAADQAAPAKTREELTKDVEARVREIYDAVIATYTPDATGQTISKARLDERFCSDDWLAALKAVGEKDKNLEGEIGFFEADYWVMGQDFQNLKAENIKVESLSPEEGKATATLDWHNCGSITKIKVDLVFENNEWKIDELTDQTHGDTGWKADMKDYLK